MMHQAAITAYLNVACTIGFLHPFWQSTGFCPPDPHQNASHFLLSQDMHQNLAFFGSLPSDEALKQVRVHWLLDTITVKDFSRAEFNFKWLDQFIELLHFYDLKPGFEVMGNPSNVFADFENATQLHVWRKMIWQLADRYIKRYGLQYVSTWNFETWNEPDNHDFDGLNFTIQGFVNYAMASSEALYAAHPSLKFGGPGDACRRLNTSRQAGSFCYAMLKHSFPKIHKQGKGIPIDYISVHKKGDGKASNILHGEIETLKIIYNLFPSLKHVPFINSEADPLVGWAKPEEWRADATYAAVVIKTIVQHVYHSIHHPNSPAAKVSLLSNDNGFLSYHPHHFTQRTLLARFQMNNTRPRHVQFIRKPVYMAMGLLSRLGEVVLDSKIAFSSSVNFSSVGILPTIHLPKENQHGESFQVSILVYNSQDTANVTGSVDVHLHLNLSKYFKDDLLWMQYSIDNVRTNPYDVWKYCGSPSFPDSTCFLKMRQAEGPYVSSEKPQPIQSPLWELTFTSLLPGVSLIHICSKGFVPDKVERVSFINVTKDNILILWKPVRTRCLLAYEVEFSVDGVDYMQINRGHVTIYASFQFTPVGRTETECRICGYYRVRAVDFWMQRGPYSHPGMFMLQ